MLVTEKTGPVLAIKAVVESDDLMITTRSGITIRTKVSEVRLMGRSTQGVRIIRLDGNDSIADVAIVAADTDIEGEDENGNEATDVQNEE